MSPSEPCCHEDQRLAGLLLLLQMVAQELGNAKL